MKRLSAEEVIRQLRLEWLPPEGGYFRSTYVAATQTPANGGTRYHSTAIYYLVTPEGFSALHRLPQDEIFHFYRGDTVEMLLLHEDGKTEVREIGSRFEAGQHPQVLAPGRVWQGTRLKEGGRWALLGCTVAPGFDYSDYEHGKRSHLIKTFPQHRTLIEKFTREET